MSSPRVALDVTPLQNSHRSRGIGTYVRGLVSRLLEQDEIPLEVWGWTTGSPVVEVRPPHSAKWLRRPPMPSYRGSWVFASGSTWLHARTSTAVAVHVTDPEALIRLPGRQVMTTVYDLIPLHEGIPRRRLVTWAGYQRYLRALKFADAYFAISAATRDDLIAQLGLDPEHVDVAEPGVEVSSGAVGSAAPVRPYFLFVGGPNPNKNVHVMLEAFAVEDNLGEELLIAGPWLPEQKARLETQIAADDRLKDRARHLGYVDAGTLPKLMRDATAVVVPSRAEGFGLPVAEALAAGAAVVHSDIRVLNDVSMGAAATFSADSPDELAMRLREVSTNSALQNRLRGLGRQRAQQLTWSSAVTVTLERYRKVLAASTVARGRR